MQAKILTILASKERKKIEKIIKKNYEVDFDLSNYSVLIGPEDKIWIASREILNADIEKLDVNSIGMNLGKLKKNEKSRLTIEGSQLIGKEAKRNLIELNEEEAKKFMSGSSLQIVPSDCDMHNFVIIKSGKNILGSGLLTEKGIKNLLPRSRRV